jgi:hypothetical protein
MKGKDQGTRNIQSPREERRTGDKDGGVEGRQDGVDTRRRDRRGGGQGTFAEPEENRGKRRAVARPQGGPGAPHPEAKRERREAETHSLDRRSVEEEEGGQEEPEPQHPLKTEAVTGGTGISEIDEAQVETDTLEEVTPTKALPKRESGINEESEPESDEDEVVAGAGMTAGESRTEDA